MLNTTFEDRQTHLFEIIGKLNLLINYSNFRSIKDKIKTIRAKGISNTEGVIIQSLTKSIMNEIKECIINHFSMPSDEEIQMLEQTDPDLLELILHHLENLKGIDLNKIDEMCIAFICQDIDMYEKRKEKERKEAEKRYFENLKY